eukprot:gnl/MRDRNA2_/MRDRNA2_70210_c0_seq1.p1 gnl/MRDRNA2_/MRDRNA2_70210_c0~~gnl/MRDRNA2_/MRDRNA2_70210_c0_seq1.p1  ORF type:complete len:961 (+),score=159.57 gnl/MRDRNA2_/MRDRNA2_70210_c0_seq1:97-2979(+)
MDAFAASINIIGNSARVSHPFVEKELKRNSQVLGSWREHSELVRKGSMRTDHKRRNSGISGESPEMGQAASIPTQAYSSACPVQAVGCISSEKVPITWKESRYCQGMFGNIADFSTKSRIHSNSVNRAERAQGKMGLPSLEAAGWITVNQPAMISRLTEEIEKEHFYLALRLHGLEAVRKEEDRIDDPDRMMITFPKADIPGSASEVKSLIKSLKNLDHINIVKFLEACEDDNAVYFIYEEFDGAGYLPMVVLNKTRNLESRVIANICQQLAAACNFYTKHRLSLGDWSIWHVMSTSYSMLEPIKIFGVGLAGVMHRGTGSRITENVHGQNTDYIKGILGSIFFHSPEQVESKGHSLARSKMEASDIWAIGVLFFTVSTNHYPFYGADDATVQKKISEQVLNFDSEFSHIEPEGALLLQSMLEKDARKRPSPEDIVTNSWIRLKTRSLDSNQLETVVDTMLDFAEMKPVMRSLGKLFVQYLRTEKQNDVEAKFRLLDVKGDGEVDLDEFTTLAFSRKHDVRKLFKILDDDGSMAISPSEFVLANVYSQEVLTERTLRAAFSSMDKDGTQAITATEIYKALRTIDPEHPLEVRDVLEFMGDLDKDMDADLDFDEFRAFFPKVVCRQDVLDKRSDAAYAKLNATQDIFKSFLKVIEAWLADLKACKDNLESMKLSTEAGEGSSSFDDLKACLRNILRLVSRPPKVNLPRENLDVFLESKRRSDRSEERRNLPVKQFHQFLHMRAEAWKHDFEQMANRAYLAKREDSKKTRALEMNSIIVESMNDLDKVFRWVEHSLQEATDVLEAAVFSEGSVPHFPPVHRGLPDNTMANDTDGVFKAIQDYQKMRVGERKEEALRNQQKLEKEQKRKEQARMKRRASHSEGMPIEISEDHSEDQNLLNRRAAKESGILPEMRRKFSVVAMTGSIINAMGGGGRRGSAPAALQGGGGRRGSRPSLSSSAAGG